MTREEFVRVTVAQTIGVYLQRYCRPYTNEDAQVKCVEDAERLADRLYGGRAYIDMPAGLPLPAAPVKVPLARLGSGALRRAGRRG
jgi:hypothetical protein